MIFCSSIIPTVGRPSLTKVVHSLLEQKMPNASLEIIVVNDSGRPLANTEWHHHPQIHIINTQQRERCVARNVGAAVAQGNYLHFIDDDDWVLPDAINALYELAQHNPSVDWLLGSTQLVGRDDGHLIHLRHNMQGNLFLQTIAGEWLPLQSSLIKTEAFWHIGGFNPQIPGIEDIDLARRMTLHGDVATTPFVTAAVGMGEEASTTNRQKALIAGRMAREAILSSPTAYERMAAGASDSYWQGRITRAYLTSAVWNLTHKRPFTALNRLWHSGRSGLKAGTQLFNRNYWQAIYQSYQSITFAQGIKEAGL